MSAKEKEWKRLAQDCRNSLLELYGSEEKVIVFGEGDANARVMLIGEAPGEQETLQRRPFVGKAGQNLDAFLAVLGLERASLYITNVVKFRPCVFKPETGRWSNRAPGREEVEVCLPWLREELRLVRPELVVTLGNVALKALQGPKASVGLAHGRRTEGALAAEEGRDVFRFQLFPLYHPASIIYNRDLRAVYDADLRQLKRELRLAED